MSQTFLGWADVAERLRKQADAQQRLATDSPNAKPRLNEGQCASLRAIADRVVNNGVVIADEVGMGKTRIAVDVAKSVFESGGRVAILVPPGLGDQWQTELRDGGLADVPPILRTLRSFLEVWNEEDPANQQPWFNKKVIVISHILSRWRLGNRSDSLSFALLPELFAQWGKYRKRDMPYGYHTSETLYYATPFHAAKSIVEHVQQLRDHSQYKWLDELIDKVKWQRLLKPGEYFKNGEIRGYLERSVGLGLGTFDLVIIDEAHKSRDEKSGLSNLLESVLMKSMSTRRIAMTATPVELDVSQWESTLKRLDLSKAVLKKVGEVCQRYQHAVERLRKTWRTSEEARREYSAAAKLFQDEMSPYLLRRDKREEESILKFREYTNLPFHEYRQQIEIHVDTESLIPEWKQAWRHAICAAEALSLLTTPADKLGTQRMRLTMGNGHGVSRFLDEFHRSDDDQKQDASDAKSDLPQKFSRPKTAFDAKREERAKWWRESIGRSLGNGDEALLFHPAMLKAVETIEKATKDGEKVLVFGKFTRPMRALVSLLNAKAMLTAIEADTPWPQAVIHGEQNDSLNQSDWPAVRAAREQLGCKLSLEEIAAKMKESSKVDERNRRAFRENLIMQIKVGMSEMENVGARNRAIFAAFKESMETTPPKLPTVARAIAELIGDVSEKTSALKIAVAFCELVQAMSDHDSFDDDDDDDADKVEAAAKWEIIERRLNEEISQARGSFARLMFGETRPESRRMIQAGFNRASSNPRVLVAQSLVGREGLNLHHACRIVVLLHPEWNPGVVEQQIGRVDRVGSHWSQQLDQAITNKSPAESLKRIEVRPIIFRGTYDEWNWDVLKTRWANLRAQLHGIVIESEATPMDSEFSALIAEIKKNSPDFSPKSYSSSFAAH